MEESAENKFAKLCVKMKWRRTVQRRAVYFALCGNKAHPSVVETTMRVRESVPYISADSVARILCDFASAGIFRRLDGLEAVRFDSNPSPHSHFVCSKCGKVFDVACEMPKIALPRGCGKISSVELRLSGICSQCAHLQTQSAGIGRTQKRA